MLLFLYLPWFWESSSCSISNTFCVDTQLHRTEMTLVHVLRCSVLCWCKVACRNIMIYTDIITFQHDPLSTCTRSTLWHKPNYSEILIHCFHVPWCIIMKVLFFTVVKVNSYAMVSKCLACYAEGGRWMNIITNEWTFSLRMIVFAMPAFRFGLCFMTRLAFRNLHSVFKSTPAVRHHTNSVSKNAKAHFYILNWRRSSWYVEYDYATWQQLFFLRVYFVCLGIIGGQWRCRTLRTAALNAFSLH